ncbi:MAG: 6-carboxytetrahydropterin synthase, partial [Spirochaetaceae bacterium]|nr:6-carboxytetrahydropterin synthase [Spirochaetaceae bacterium]
TALLDHTNLNDHPAFNQDPSAERIAAFIFRQVEARVPFPDLLWAVEVFETPTNIARYERDVTGG